jgi:hypothetical protein
MRQTKLWDEKHPTPEFYSPKVTRIGKPASMKPKPKPYKTKSKRFSQYELDSNRLGASVGPGSYSQYNYCISSVSKSPVMSKHFYRHKDKTNHSHYYIDNLSTIPNYLKYFI